MKKIFVISLLFIIASSNVFAEAKKSSDFKTFKEKLSYTLGYDVGKTFGSMSIDIDKAIFMMALSDGIIGNKAVLTEGEMKEILVQLNKDIAQRLQEKEKINFAKNQKEGQEFLLKNKNNPGVVTLPDGLQYLIVNKGTGKKPAATDTVVVHYKGMFIDKKEFDSSYSRNEPATFQLNQVIKGWTEGLQYISAGGKIILYIPYELGYGETSAGNIPAGSVLIFEVELLEVK